MKHSRHPLSTYYDFLIAFLSPFKLWEIWWQTLYIISRSFIRRQIWLAAEVRSGLLGTQRHNQISVGSGRGFVKSSSEIKILDSRELAVCFPCLMISFLWCCWSGLRSSFQVSPVVWFIDRVTQGTVSKLKVYDKKNCTMVFMMNISSNMYG